MSTSVEGIVPPNEEWQKMKDAFDACEKAGIDPPSELWNFFDGERPDDAGIVVVLTNAEFVSEYNNDMSTGVEVELAQLDPKIKILRFTNNY